MITGKRIGVLMGGLSSEREVSLKTGGLVAASLVRMGYDVVTIDAGRDLPVELENKGVEVAFIALHGRYGEDGCVQGLLEVMGISYTGSGVTASAACMDKLLSKKLFEYNGIQTPKFSVYNRSDGGEPPAMRYPCVVKPCSEGSAIGISLISRPEDYTPALEKACRYGDEIIIEEYIAGREITAGILNDRALPLIEIIPETEFYDYTTKMTGGRARYEAPADIPTPATQYIQSAALKAHKALGCSFLSRVDFRVDPAGNPYALEVNTIPGMTENSLLPMAAKEAGIEYDNLVEMILSSAFIKKKGFEGPGIRVNKHEPMAHKEVRKSLSPGGEGKGEGDIFD